MFKSLKTRLAGLGALALASVGSAQAAVDPAVTTALTDGAVDAAAVASLTLIIVVAISVIAYMKKGAK